MFISDIEKNAKHASKTAFIYLLISLFLVLFGAVYEWFSHGVYSYHMLYAFVFPLAGGTLPFSILSLTGAKPYPGKHPRNLYHSGIATMTVGSVVRGVLDIYGTTNALSGFYWPIGFCLAAAGIVIYAVSAIRQRHE